MEAIKQLLHQLQKVNGIHEQASPAINPDNFKSKLKMWTEATTASPSGLHLGHFKSLIARHSFATNVPDEDLTPEFSSTQRVKY
jgi:hypothetical protein